MGAIARSDILDLGFLHRQTIGDRKLQLQLLSLFEEQCAELGQILLGAADPETRLHAAHKLQGCAAAIGAGRIAHVAGALVQALEAGEGAETRSREPGIKEAIEEAREAIRIWRAGSSDDLAKRGEVA